jgi:hypothetical protein
MNDTFDLHVLYKWEEVVWLQKFKHCNVVQSPPPAKPAIQINSFNEGRVSSLSRFSNLDDPARPAEYRMWDFARDRQFRDTAQSNPGADLEGRGLVHP